MLAAEPLWELCDQFEDRSKDRHRYGPLQRYIWAEARDLLAVRLGERTRP